MVMTEILPFPSYFFVWVGLEHADILFLNNGIWKDSGTVRVRQTGSGTTGTAGTFGGYLLGRVEGRRYIR